MEDSKQRTAASGKWKFETVTSVMNSIGTVWVFILLIILNLDIFGRFVFNYPIRGVPEIVALSIVALVFMQIAHTLKVGRMTRSETILNWLRKRFPKFGYLLEGIFHLVGAFIFAVIFQGSLSFLVKAWEIDEYVGAEGDFMAPVWPVKLIILIGSVAAFIQFLLMALDNFRQIGRTVPVTDSENQGA